MKYKEMKQLEVWTSLKCGDILFYHNEKGFSTNISNILNTLFGKKQILFLIEDKSNEKYGYYLNTTIEEKYDSYQKTDNKTFHFNLDSNGRLSKPMKYEIKNRKYGGICLKFIQQTGDLLIILGYIILVVNKIERKVSNIDHWNNSFNFHGIKRPFSKDRKYDYFSSSC